MKRFKFIPWIAFLPLVMGALIAHAHGSHIGDIRIDHPYAMPTRPGLSTGAVYFRALHNTGTVEDRLVSASTPAAGRVELHCMQMQGEVMRMAAVPHIFLPARSNVPMKHGSHDGHHLMLFELKAPLKDGDRFPVTLTFERAGSVQVQVWVQNPRASGAAHAH